MSADNPKIRLLIDMGTAKLRDDLNKMRAMVNAGAGDAKRKLDMTPKLNNAEFRRSLSTMQKDMASHTRAMERSIKEMSASLNRELQFKNAGSGGGSILGSVIGGNLIAGAISKAGNMATQLVGDSISMAMEAGKNKASFQVMAGSKAGNRLYDDLTKYARDSIYGNEVYQNAQTMLGFGINDAKVMPYMKMLGDVAMGDSQKLQSLTLAFSQVQAAGRLQGQDLLQLINAGFNPLGIIAEKTGKSIATLKKEMEKGKISFKMVEDAFKAATAEGGRFHDMTNKIAETPYGKWQALQGQIEGVKTDLGNMLLPYASSLMDTTADLLNWLGIHKTVPETLATEKTEIDVLLQSITGLNEGNDVRAQMLDKLKAKYPDLFGNLDTEKIKNNELLSLLGQVNSMYERRIELAGIDYKMQQNKDEIRQLLDLEVKARAQASTIGPKGFQPWFGDGSTQYMGYWDRAKMNQLVDYPGDAFSKGGLLAAADAMRKRRELLTGANNRLESDKPSLRAQELLNGYTDMARSGAVPMWWGKDAVKLAAELKTVSGEILKHQTDKAWLAGKEGTAAMENMERLLNPSKVDMNGNGGGMKPGGGDTVSDANSSSRVTGSAAQVRNVNVTFGAYIKGDVITQNKQIQNMSKEELDRWLREHYQRLLHDIENAYQ
jgi:tape measure domain-containing protein